MNLELKYSRRETIVRREIAGEAFLIPVCGSPVDMENIFVLNAMADFIWRRLDGRNTLSAILGAVTGEFVVSPEVAKSDLAELIATLLDRGLIEAAA